MGSIDLMGIKKLCSNVTISNTGIPVPKIKQEQKKTSCYSNYSRI